MMPAVHRDPRQHRTPSRHRSHDDEHATHGSAGRERAVGEQTVIADGQAETRQQPHAEEQADLEPADRPVEQQASATSVPTNGSTSNMMKCRRCSLRKCRLLMIRLSRISAQAMILEQPLTRQYIARTTPCAKPAGAVAKYRTTASPRRCVAQSLGHRTQAYSSVRSTRNRAIAPKRWPRCLPDVVNEHPAGHGDDEHDHARRQRRETLQRRAGA